MTTTATPKTRKMATKSAQKAHDAEVKAEVKAAEAAAKPVVEKKERVPRVSKFTAPADLLALKIVNKIRDDRSAFTADEVQTSESGESMTRSFSSTIGSARVFIGRHETAGKKSKEIIARAFIHVKPETGKHLEITGPLAARAWFALTHEAKGHGKTAPDAETVDAAAAALGL